MRVRGKERREEERVDCREKNTRELEKESAAEERTQVKRIEKSEYRKEETRQHRGENAAERIKLKNKKQNQM